MNIIKWISKKHNIITHIILTYITCGLWLIIWLIFRNYNKSKVNENFNNFTSNNDLDEYYEIQKKYQKALTLHYSNLEKINMLYTIANNLTQPNSNEMQQVVSLCLEDIKLAPELSNYCKEIANYYKDDLDNHLMNYGSFQRLAIIYEKQNEYEKAIDICKYAIQLGFYKDGTAGQMPGRLARLIKKHNNQSKKLRE